MLLTRLGVVLCLALATTGCALVNQLKQDAAIVGTTGFSLSIGFDPAPENAMFPLPKVKLVYGTAWRVGVHDCVYISNAAGASAYIRGTPTPPATTGATTGTGTTGAALPAPTTTTTTTNVDTTRANCIPVNTMMPAANDAMAGSGAVGNAQLTISASGLEALKALGWKDPK